MSVRLVIISGCILFSSCSDRKSEVENKIAETELSEAISTAIDTSIHYSYSVFEVPPSENNADEGFGFEIHSKQSGGMNIRQNTIPAVQGNHPFLSEENAAATAQLMIHKLEKGIVPPAISVEELDSLGVVY